MKSTLRCVLVFLYGITLVSGQAVPVITWASDPVLPGEYAVLQGGHFCERALVDIFYFGDASPVPAALALHPVQLTNHSMKVLIPSTLTIDAYRLTVHGCGNGPPAQIVVNRADPWWQQGDAGSSTTPGGWIRVFGKCLGGFQPQASGGVPSQGQSRLESQRQEDVKIERLRSAAQMNDFELAARLAHELLDARASRTAAASVVGGGGTELLLKPVSGAPSVRLLASTLDEPNDASFGAWFDTPADLPLGKYQAWIRNGLGGASNDTWVPLASFLNATHASDGIIIVSSGYSRPSKLFNVTSYGPCGEIQYNSTIPVLAALAAAATNGGGVVYLPRGQYYLRGPLPLAAGVTLQGEGQELVSIYFEEQEKAEAPVSYLELSGTRPGPVAVQDLSFYITRFYHTLATVRQGWDGFRMHRVRVRASPFFCLYPPFSSPGRGPPGKPGRQADYTLPDLSPPGVGLLTIHADDFEVTECDLYAAGHVLASSFPGARYGLVARNRIWNGGAAHWLDNFQQLIYEHNTVTGISIIAFGNNVVTYGGGFSQHIYHARNSFEHVWGGDREVMTFDNLGGSYAGFVSGGSNGSLHVSADALTTWREEVTHGQGGGYVIDIASPQALGAAVAILDGPGRGQYRRLVMWNASSQQMHLDQPFDPPPDPELSFVNVGPFRGRMIFHANRYADCGAFQLYAHAFDVIVSSTRFERAEGLLSWGRASAGNYCPNLRCQFLDNYVVEGNHVFNYGGSYPYPHAKTVEPYFFGILASDQYEQNLPFQGAINQFIVWRRNQIFNNGGLVVRGNSADVLVEATEVRNSSVGVAIGDANCEYQPREANGACMPGAPRNGCALRTQNSTVLIVPTRYNSQIETAASSSEFV